MTPTRFIECHCDAITLARRLLGQKLVRVLNGERLAGIIVETEAYLGAVDLAAHTARGRRTPRNESMYLGGGFAYVYFTYGMHYCFNIVAGMRDDGVAVLIRAIEPVEGIAQMRRNRGVERESLLCSGPARLTQALSIDRDLNGVDLRVNDQLFVERERTRALPGHRVGTSARIGVSYAREWADRPLRFFVKGSNWVSGPKSLSRDRI